MFRKAQAAMEFLMTYGWALIVVLVAIAALAFFGVLNPGQFLPEKCTIAPGVGCLEFVLTDQGAHALTVVMQNGIGSDMKNINFTLSNCYPGDDDDYNATYVNKTDGDESLVDFNFVDGDTVQFKFDCYDDADAVLSAGSKIKTDITMRYETASGIEHTKRGTIVVEVMEG